VIDSKKIVYHADMRFESNHSVIEILYEYITAVKMGYSAHYGPAHSGFGLPRTGLKNSDKIWTAKTSARARPDTGFRGLALFF
jgi:hypothetical protein